MADPNLTDPLEIEEDLEEEEEETVAHSANPKLKRQKRVASGKLQRKVAAETVKSKNLTKLQTMVANYSDKPREYKADRSSGEIVFIGKRGIGIRPWAKEGMLRGAIGYYYSNPQNDNDYISGGGTKGKVALTIDEIQDFITSISQILQHLEDCQQEEQKRIEQIEKARREFDEMRYGALGTRSGQYYGGGRQGNSRFPARGRY